MLKGRDIVCISSIDWDANWQGNQELMSIYARNGNSILYIENTGLRAPRLLRYDAQRVAHRLKHLFQRGLKGLRREGENITIYTPLFFPWARGGMGRRINRLLWRKGLEEAKGTLRQDPILITWLPTPAALDLISALEGKGSVVVYYNLIDFHELSGGDEVIQRSERELLERADLVFAWTDKLCCYFRGFTRNVYRTYPSVNLNLFNPEAKFRRPPDLEGLEGPILGYTGALHKHLDVELLSRIAKARPRWQLVLVGPVATDVDPLRRHSNVHLIDNQPHERIPSFLAAFDICLIPYRVWRLTETVDPIKLKEYLAMGKPVVST
ncbi:MAG: glycosyltransferase, partial [Nitrospinota bacterium]